MDRSSFYSNFRHQIVFGAERLLNGIQQLCMATRRQISDAAGIGGNPAHPITLQQFYQKQKEPIQIDSFQSKYVYRSSLSRRL